MAYRGVMARLEVTPVVAADAAEVATLLAAVELALYGHTTFSQADLEEEWADADLARDGRAVRDGGRLLGYAMITRRTDYWRVHGNVHPDALGRGVGTLIATGAERDAAASGVRRLQNSVFEADGAGRTLIEALGYVPVRVFREMRIQLTTAPAAPEWPDGLHVGAFDAVRDGRAFHAAHQEAFADHWEHSSRDYASWSRVHLETPRFEPALWCMVRAGDEIAGGAICTGDTYGGGWIDVLFTRRPWRGQGVGGALLQDAFSRLWDRGERTIGLGVDAGSDTGAFRVYERAGMTPTLAWVIHEKALDPS